MIVILKVMVDDGVIGMVGFDQVLETSCPSVRICLNMVNLD